MYYRRYIRVCRVLMLILETNNLANNKRLPKRRQHEQCFLAIKRAIANKLHKNELRFSSTKGDKKSTIYLQFDK